MRRLAAKDYMQTCEIEYIVAELRSRIYWKPKDVRYFERVMKSKVKIIDDISKKNFIPCIFNDTFADMRARGKVFIPTGYPDFHYNDHRGEREEFEKKDFYCYFSKDSDVQVTSNGVRRLGRVRGWENYFDVVLVEVDSEILEVNYKSIRRIL